MTHFRIYPSSRQYGIVLFYSLVLFPLAANAMEMADIVLHYYHQLEIYFSALYFFQDNPIILIIALFIVLITTFILIYMEQLHLFWRILFFTLLIFALVVCLYITIGYFADRELSTVLALGSVNEINAPMG